MSKSDQQLAMLSTLLQSAEQDSLRLAEWEGSQFKWLLSLPPATRGKIARDLIGKWAMLNGVFPKIIRGSAPGMMWLGNRSVRIKSSTLWHTGIYRFQQFRDEDFDFCLLLGISPSNIHIWFASKDALETHVIGTYGQHTGTTSRETYWLELDPASPPKWLDNPSGDLGSAADRLVDISQS